MSTGFGSRLTHKAGERADPGVERTKDGWEVRSLEGVRRILRSRGATKQAGFNAETMTGLAVRHHPVLFQDGEAHRQQRSRIARFFTPKTVEERYRALMEAKADELVGEIVDAGVVALDQASMRYAVEITAAVLGLTDSDPNKMAKRLSRFFQIGKTVGAPEGLWQTLRQTVITQPPMAAFFLRDVRPAIRRRRKQAGDDVISYLIAEGYSDPEILFECITYAAAGMVTTREFICVAMWHLLRDEALADRFQQGSDAEKHAILLEILRLEPVVGHLYRRMAEDLEIPGEDGCVHLKEGDLVDLSIRSANADAAVGEEPLEVCPMRDLPRGIRPEVMSFGDGPHRCPGNALAMGESAILLERLLARDVTILSEPNLDWMDLIAGYEVRDLVLRVR